MLKYMPRQWPPSSSRNSNNIFNSSKGKLNRGMPDVVSHSLQGLSFFLFMMQHNRGKREMVGGMSKSRPSWSLPFYTLISLLPYFEVIYDLDRMTTCTHPFGV